MASGLSGRSPAELEALAAAASAKRKADRNARMAQRGQQQGGRPSCRPRATSPEPKRSSSTPAWSAELPVDELLRELPEAQGRPSEVRHREDSESLPEDSWERLKHRKLNTGEVMVFSGAFYETVEEIHVPD
eukprot:RCo053593